MRPPSFECDAILTSWFWKFRAAVLLAIATLTLGPDLAIADYFATPPCVSPTGCIFFSPKYPAPDENINVAIVPSSIPADACVRSLSETMTGDVIQITGAYVHCYDVVFPEPPPTYLYTSVAPLAVGRYTVQVTLSPNPPNGWPYGNPGEGLFQGPITLTTALNVLVTPPPPTNYEGLWWNAPAGSESGWGINLAHQGDIIFATWFTYDFTGKGWWLSMTAPNAGPGAYPDTYTGTVYQTTGPAFNAMPFDPTQVIATPVGSGTLNFADASNGTFSYSVYGFSQVKSITHQVFGPLPVCATATASLAAATNYQDLWWASPAGSESGWGINLTHQGDAIFATWFTYDVDHTPMWLAVVAPKIAPGAYSGMLYRTTGPAFDAVPFNPENVAETVVGITTFTFSDGNAGVFAYTVNGVVQSKSITREVFSPPGTVCQ
jgi:hypothetical protein